MIVLVFKCTPENILKDDYVTCFDSFGVKCISEKVKKLISDKYI